MLLPLILYSVTEHPGLPISSNIHYWEYSSPDHPAVLCRCSAMKVVSQAVSVILRSSVHEPDLHYDMDPAPESALLHLLEESDAAH